MVIKPILNFAASKPKLRHLARITHIIGEFCKSVRSFFDPLSFLTFLKKQNGPLYVLSQNISLSKCSFVIGVMGQLPSQKIDYALINKSNARISALLTDSELLYFLKGFRFQT